MQHDALCPPAAVAGAIISAPINKRLMVGEGQHQRTNFFVQEEKKCVHRINNVPVLYMRKKTVMMGVLGARVLPLLLSTMSVWVRSLIQPDRGCHGFYLYILYVIPFFPEFWFFREKKRLLSFSCQFVLTVSYTEFQIEKGREFLDGCRIHKWGGTRCRSNVSVSNLDVIIITICLQSFLSSCFLVVWLPRCCRRDHSEC